MLILGISAQGGGWLFQLSSRQFRATYLGITTAGCAITLVATTSLREVIRLSQIDLTLVAAQTADAFKVRGFVVFVVFAVMNALLIGLCIWLVKKGFVGADKPPEIDEDEANAPVMQT